MNTSTERKIDNSTDLKKVSLAVIGVGGAGGNAVAHMAMKGLADVSFAVVHTDAQALRRCKVPQKLAIGAQVTRGLSTGGDPERGRAAAEEDATQLRQLCGDAAMVFIVAGLGGGTGSGVAPVLAQMAKEGGALVLALVTMPFDCEGAHRQAQAKDALDRLKAAADGVICLPNQKVFKLLDEDAPVLEAFEKINDLLTEGVCGIQRLLTSEGLVHIDFADLCRVLRCRHTESVLATAEARGPNRAQEVLEKLLASPLLEGGQALSEAGDVLVSLVGGPTLSLADIRRVMEAVQRQSENAHLILGAAIDQNLGERLVVTLVASRRSGEEMPAEARPAASPRRGEASHRPPGDAPELSTQLLNPETSGRSPSRFVAPPPELTPEKAEQLLTQQGVSAGRQRRQIARMRQGQLPLDIIAKGRFEKSEPTIHHGEDLDVPTYIRRGVALN